MIFQLDKLGLLKTPLQKIVTGGTLLAVAFIMSGIVELILEKTYPHPPGSTSARLALHNSVPNCDLEFKIKIDDGDFEDVISAACKIEMSILEYF